MVVPILSLGFTGFGAASGFTQAAAIASPALSDTITGSIIVTSTPEDGISIHLNGRPTGLETPNILTNVALGEHSVRLVSPYFRSEERIVRVEGVIAVAIDFQMIPTFGTMKVNTTAQANIYIDGQLVGNTQWEGRVAEGDRWVTAEREGYATREWNVRVVRGRTVELDLLLQPLTGTLEIKSDPEGSRVLINGIYRGNTPLVLPQLPVGTYNLQIQKENYQAVLKSVTVEKLVVTTVDVKLGWGREITVSSIPEGAELIVNEVMVGVTPLTHRFRYGTNNILLVKGTEMLAQTIDVTPAVSRNFTFTLSPFVDIFDDQMVLVEGGTFRMGDTFGLGNKEEKPVQEVTVSTFFIGKYEVTNSQWFYIMGSIPSHFSACADCPVERVSWDDVQIFLSKLNRLSGKNYRLPTEAEWEYAARGGSRSKGFRFAGHNNINNVSWYSVNSQNRTQPVGGKLPNELGLYDMSGNVWEWCFDWLAPYTSDSKTNPRGPSNGSLRVVRGGSWFGYVGGSRVSCRGGDDAASQRSYIGFRVVLEPKQE